MESAEVTAALQSSRYNETVVVNVSAGSKEEDPKQPLSSDGEGTTREILLIPCLDEDNGGVIWNDLAAAATAETNSTSEGNGKNSSHERDDTNTRVDIGIVRHLRTKRWFFPMLNDRHRNKLYETAIRAASYQVVRRFRNNNSNNNNVIRVLDIGSGTGLLAMLAAKYIRQALDETNGNSKQQQQQQQQPSVEVTSLEMSAAMSRLARLTVSDNHLQDTVSILEHHSTELLSSSQKQLEKKDDNNDTYDLCVSELLESSLLGEGMLPALRDAWDRLLHSQSTVVPQKARVFCQLVEGDFLSNYWGPHGESVSTAAYNGSCGSNATTSSNDQAQQHLRLSLSDNHRDDVMLDGGARGGTVLHIHAEHWVDGQNSTSGKGNRQHVVKPLSKPIEVFDFDFSSPDRIPGPEGRRLPLQVVPHTAGTCHAVLFWWELDLWRDDRSDSNEAKENVGSCTYSTQVGQAPWQDHWHQNLFVFTNNNVSATTHAQATKTDDNTAISFGYKVQAQEPCTLVASHNDTSIWFGIKAEMGTPNNNSKLADGNPPIKKQKTENDESDAKTAPIYQVVPETEAVASQSLISPSRAWQLNDQERLQLLRKGIREALEQKGKNAVVLDLSDFSLCAILAALEGASRVSSVESSSGVIPNLSARVAQLANGLPKNNDSDAATDNNIPSMFQVLQCHAEQLSLELLNGDDDGSTAAESPNPVEVVMAEPYYDMLEGWHLQEALNYFYLVRALKGRGILSKTVISVPSFAVVRGCAIQSFSLKHAYGRCGGAVTSDVADSNGKHEAPICGFDHASANRHGDRFDCHDLSLPMWEYEFVELTESFDIAKLLYSSTNDAEKELSPQILEARVPFQQSGSCHGMMVWIDYGIGTTSTALLNDSYESSNATEFLKTRGRPYRQLVRIISTPVTIATEDLDRYEFVCNFKCGGQPQLESHNFDIQVVEKIDAVL